MKAIHCCRLQVYLHSLEVPLHQLQPPPGSDQHASFPSLSDTPFTFVDTPELLAEMMEEIKGETEIAVICALHGCGMWVVCSYVRSLK